jgi:hypothetical protein
MNKNFDMKSYNNPNMLNQNEIQQQEDIYNAEKFQEFISTLKNEFQLIGKNKTFKYNLNQIIK